MRSSLLPQLPQKDTTYPQDMQYTQLNPHHMSDNQLGKRGAPSIALGNSILEELR